jgi:hypothetical protein
MSDGERRRRKRSLFVFVFGAENIKLRLLKKQTHLKIKRNFVSKQQYSTEFDSIIYGSSPLPILFTVIHCIEYHLIFLVIPPISLLILDIFNYSCRILETPDC